MKRSLLLFELEVVDRRMHWDLDRTLALQRMVADVQEVVHIVVGAEAVLHRIPVAREQGELLDMVVVHMIDLDGPAHKMVVHAIELGGIAHKMVVRMFLEWKNMVVGELENTPENSRVAHFQLGDNQWRMLGLCMLVDNLPYWHLQRSRVVLT